MDSEADIFEGVKIHHLQTISTLSLVTACTISLSDKIS